MNSPHGLQHHQDLPPAAERAELVARYKHIRSVSRELAGRLIERMPRDILDEGAEKLGVLHEGTLVFDSEEEMAVLMDYCLYDIARQGRTLVEQHLVESPPDPDSDEMTVLRSMQHAVYSVFEVEAVEPGLGFVAQDLGSEESSFVVDIGLSQSVEPGFVIAGRLLSLDGFAMTSGAALPVGQICSTSERHEISKMFKDVLGGKEGGPFDPAPLIRKLLQRGGSSSIQYVPAELASGPGQPQLSSQSNARQGRSASRSAKTGRNAPCPCGSGRKFKQCCLKRR